MKKALATLLAATFAFGFSTSCFAQTPGPDGQAGTLNAPAQKHHGGYNGKVIQAALKDILPTLSLSGDQQSQIDALISKTEDQAKQIRKDTKGDKIARQDKMGQLGEDFHKQLFSILNPAQTKQFKEEYKAFMKKWHDEHKKATTTTPAPSTTPSTTGH